MQCAYYYLKSRQAAATDASQCGFSTAAPDAIACCLVKFLRNLNAWPSVEPAQIFQLTWKSTVLYAFGKRDKHTLRKKPFNKIKNIQTCEHSICAHSYKWYPIYYQ